MTEPIEPDELSPEDGPLLARLEAMFSEADPAPAEAVALAKASFILRSLDAELAALVEDSESESAEPAGSRAMAVRGPGAAPQPRQLTFQVVDERGHDEVVIAVQVEAVGARRRLTGHLAPQGPATIEVRQTASAQARSVDADGRGLFIIDDVLPGPMSLTLRRAGSPAVATQWTLV
ncbi:hypothetical protein [Winogradskya humida]|uniref:Carboxypeptidase family protein n=1 Tax=Winogradskya humida TaxID=113566 RepID=A0ABQ3ZXD3_9ACTN|nr:hypothetical protein [Actinoplanes humidus]GIE23248.1 hypothetical protein Ahu01nite_063500 [Actinoplanes humidus]